MRHQVDGRTFGRKSSHRKALFKNLVTALFREEKIKTTTIKAKELRRVADRLITLGKRGDLHAKRLAYQRLGNHQVVKHLFDEIAPQFATRPGGYTRIYRLSAPRMGDCADMAYIELVERAVGGSSEEKKTKQKKEKGSPSLRERIKQGISAKASRLKQGEKSRTESEEKQAEDKNAQTHSRKIHRKTSRGT